MTQRQRAKNFNDSERSYLLELIKENINTIEDRRGDFQTLKKKQETWSNIETKFNSNENVTKRDVKQLQKTWRDMKMTAKKDITKFNLLKKDTGGGPAPEKISQTSSIIKDLIPTVFQDITNKFDCDAVESKYSRVINFMPIKLLHIYFSTWTSGFRRFKSQ